MEDLLGELNAVEVDETILREVKINCQMVILTAKELCGYESQKEKFEELFVEYKMLWNLKNLEWGTEIYESILRKRIKL